MFTITTSDVRTGLDHVIDEVKNNSACSYMREIIDCTLFAMIENHGNAYIVVGLDHVNVCSSFSEVSEYKETNTVLYVYHLSYCAGMFSCNECASLF